MSENNRNTDELINETKVLEKEAALKNEKKKVNMMLGGWTKELYEWTSSIALAVVVALIINQFFFALVQVDGQSMEPTLSHGERLIVRKVMYTPEQKDVVIVKSGMLQKFIVKRVVALPGQTITFDENLNVLVDGAVIEEPYINEKQISATYLRENPYPLTVPKKGEAAKLDVLKMEQTIKANYGIKMELEVMSATTARVAGSDLVEDGLFDETTSAYIQDAYFVMGDNRNHSSDSRGLGFIPKSEIVGKAIFRILPFAKFGAIK